MAVLTEVGGFADTRKRAVDDHATMPSMYRALTVATTLEVVLARTLELRNRPGCQPTIGS